MVISSASRLFTRCPSPSGSPPNYIPNLRRIWTLLPLALLPSLINAATPGTLQADLYALHSIAASNPSFNTSWNGANPCLWLGITCNNSRVTQLYLSLPSITGPIPKEIANLSSLERLTIAKNTSRLSGPIPKEFGSLPLLTHLDISHNYHITGSIPKELGSLSSLTYLDLSNNSLTGPIPIELSSLSLLTHLDLSENLLNGSIPTELGSLSLLTHLDLSDNSLTGSIPKELSSLTSLTFLDLSLNPLAGSTLEEFSPLSLLTHLRLSGVSLGGPIPKELSSLSLLTHLDLSYNSLTGPIPKELGSLTLLTYLDLSGNPLTGSIPKELGSLTSLTDLSLSDDSLTGTIPASICKLPSLVRVDLASNNLRGPLPEAIIQPFERSEAAGSEDDDHRFVHDGFFFLGECFAFSNSDRKIVCLRKSSIGKPIFGFSDECFYRLFMPGHGKRTVFILWSVWGAIAAVVATSVTLVSERCRRGEEKVKEEKSNAGKSNVKGSSDDGNAAIGRIGVCKYLWGMLSLGFILVDVVTNFQTMKALMGGWSVYVVAFLIVLQHIVSALMLHRNCTFALPRTDVKIVWDWRRCITGFQGERSEFGREGKGIGKSLLLFLQALLSWPLRLVYVILFDILSLFSLKLGFQLKLSSGWLDLRPYWASRELTDALFQALPQAIFLSAIVAIQATPMYSKMMLDTTQVVLSISSSLGSVICVLAMVLWEARMEGESALHKLLRDFVGISPVVMLLSEDDDDENFDFEGGGKSPLAYLAEVKIAEVGKEA